MKKKDIVKIVTLLVAADALSAAGASAASCAAGMSCSEKVQDTGAASHGRTCRKAGSTLTEDVAGFNYNTTVRYKFVVTKASGGEIDLDDPALPALHRGDKIWIHQENTLAWWGDLRATDDTKPNIPTPPTCTACTVTSCSSCGDSGGN